MSGLQHKPYINIYMYLVNDLTNSRTLYIDKYDFHCEMKTQFVITAILCEKMNFINKTICDVLLTIYYFRLAVSTFI